MMDTKHLALHHATLALREYERERFKLSLGAKAGGLIDQLAGALRDVHALLDLRVAAEDAARQRVADLVGGES